MLCRPLQGGWNGIRHADYQILTWFVVKACMGLEAQMKLWDQALRKRTWPEPPTKGMYNSYKAAGAVSAKQTAYLGRISAHELNSDAIHQAIQPRAAMVLFWHKSFRSSAFH